KHDGRAGIEGMGIILLQHKCLGYVRSQIPHGNIYWNGFDVAIDNENLTFNRSRSQITTNRE
ncbi:MAG: hypothetical protein ONB05_02575, partial [candidate division KSB1 bacterium]|nr:hypothetical protein [candidate division KSB1 bacterium]